MTTETRPEGGIAALRDQLAHRDTSSLALATEALRRIARLDLDGPRLHAVPVIDPELLAKAAALDAERAAGATRGPLHGIPFSVKDSFAVEGLTMAAGSPAFADVVARRGAVVVERLLSAGALLVGRTNMPPMAIGGGQPGLYGRTSSPYNPEYLAAAWHSGSSIGSGVAVAAGFCAFGLGEETVSSGRSPASNNALVAYTPSWGVVPSLGNWPLHPYRDVVVPHTLSVADLRSVVAVISGADDGDVWARQRAVDVSAADAVAAAFRDPAPVKGSLAGLTVGVPLLYVPEETDVNGETDTDSATDTDAPTPIALRPSIRDLWSRVEAELRAAGATVVRVRFPLVEAYEGRSDLPTLEESGHLPEGWTSFELRQLVTHSWQAFLDQHAASPVALSTIAPTSIRPDPPFSVDAVANGRTHPGRDTFDYTAIVRETPLTADEVAAVATPALQGLDRARRELFEDWLTAEGIDLIAFPANSNIGHHDADVNLDSAEGAWADGSVFSTTNHVLRRVGIPSVTLPMGLMADTAMPVGATLCGPAWSDVLLLDVAEELESRLDARPVPPLPEVEPLGRLRRESTAPNTGAAAHASLEGSALIAADGSVALELSAEAAGGEKIVLEVAGQTFDLAAGTTVTTVRLDPGVRRLHGDTRVLAVLTVVASDGLVAAAASLELPFRRIDGAD